MTINDSVQTGIKLANRNIKYASEIGGISVEGLMQTFLPDGISELNRKWFSRLVNELTR